MKAIIFNYRRQIEIDPDVDGGDGRLNVGARSYNTKWLVTLMTIVACCWILIPAWTVNTVITIASTAFWIIIRKRVEYMTGDELDSDD